MTHITAQIEDADVLVAPVSVSSARDERAARFIEVRGLEKTFDGDGAPVCALDRKSVV